MTNPAKDTLIAETNGFRITSVTDVPDRDALHAMLLEYYAVIVAKLKAAGVPYAYTPEQLIASFWPNITAYTGRTGRLLLVHNADGQLIGCSTLQQIRPDAGELKRLYLTPEAQGFGLGRVLVEARIQAARDMGWQHLFVNAIVGNQDMLKIYEKMGFRFIDRYPECSDPLEVDPYFIYMTLELT